jgi:hypothetical protein
MSARVPRLSEVRSDVPQSGIGRSLNYAFFCANARSCLVHLPMHQVSLLGENGRPVATLEQISEPTARLMNLVQKPSRAIGSELALSLGIDQQETASLWPRVSLDDFAKDPKGIVERLAPDAVIGIHDGTKFVAVIQRKVDVAPDTRQSGLGRALNLEFFGADPRSCVVNLPKHAVQLIGERSRPVATVEQVSDATARLISEIQKPEPALGSEIALSLGIDQPEPAPSFGPRVSLDAFTKDTAKGIVTRLSPHGVIGIHDGTKYIAVIQRTIHFK